MVKYGTIYTAKVITEGTNNVRKGAGLVLFASLTEAEDAIV